MSLLIALVALTVSVGVPIQDIPDSSHWRLVRTNEKRLRAELRTPAAVGRPPFTSVTLERDFGDRSIVCGEFPADPVFYENGLERVWAYTIDEPRAGPCAAGSSGEFVAVGRSVGGDVRTRPIPTSP